MRVSLAPLFAFVGLAVLLGGCLTSPVERSGGPGSITVPNSNAEAIRQAARGAFARSGYTLGGSSSPSSLSFQRPAGRMGELMFGSHGQTTNFRVRLQIVPIPGTNDFRLRTQVYRVNVGRTAGFESETPMLRSWASQFQSILREIKAEAGNVGPLR